MGEKTGQENMTGDEILKRLEENRDTIRGFGVRRLGIFGSYARDEQKETSDIDFLVDFDEASLDNYFDLKFFWKIGLGGRWTLFSRTQSSREYVPQSLMRRSMPRDFKLYVDHNTLVGMHRGDKPPFT